MAQPDISQMMQGMPPQAPMQPPMGPQGPQMAPPMAPPMVAPLPATTVEEENPEQELSAKLNKILNSKNLAKGMDKDKLVKIGQFVHRGYATDKESRKAWEEQIDGWTKLALQVQETKTFPWPKASNVKYPLLSTAAMQFSARSYPSLIPSNGKLVSAKVVGKDADGQKSAKASRIEKHMSYQILEQIDDWEAAMDRLLIILPIVGHCYKKTFWDGSKKKIASRLVLPKDLVVNYWATSLEDAERKTEVIEMSKRKLREKQLLGLYCDVELGEPSSDIEDKKQTHSLNTPDNDETTPYVILEQHTYYDLDDDDYPEPYIITIEEKTKKVLRIVPRFFEEDIVMDDSGKKIAQITPFEFYTKFPFIPNPDGSFYDIGFGLLLGSINASIDTIINQLIDAGTLSNLQSGFMAKGLRIRMGDNNFKPGEWKVVNATFDDLRKGIVPLPTKEPSKTLFELLGLLIQSGKELASIADIFVGKMPGQNTPAYTTKATIEEGMKVFTAIFKRTFRALGQEYKKIYKLNSIYLDDAEEINVLDEPIQQKDYTIGDYDVCPSADPSAATLLEKQLKAQSLLELLPIGTLDPMAVTQRILDAHEQPAMEQLLMKGPPPPDPKVQEMQMKMQMEQAKAQMKMQLDQLKLKIQAAEGQQKLQLQQQEAQLKMKVKALEANLDIATAMQQHQADMQIQGQQHQMAMRTQAQQHAMGQEMEVDKHKQGLAHQQESHQAKQQFSKEEAKLKNSVAKQKAKVKPKGK